MPNYNDGVNFLKLIPRIYYYLSNEDEIIFIDDGSTDDSYEKIINLIHKNGYEKIKIYRNEKNIGVVETENLGSRLATGEFIYFAASDDDVSPEFFDACISAMEENKLAGACSTGSYLEYPGGTKINLPLKHPVNKPQYLSPEICMNYLTKNENWISGNSCIYRRKNFNQEGGFRKELEGFCDVLFTLIIPVKYGVVFIPEAMTIFRLSNKSYASKHYKLENINSTLDIIENIKNILECECSCDLANNWSERIKVQTIVSASVKEFISELKKLKINSSILALRSLLKILRMFVLNKYLYIYLKKIFYIKFLYTKSYFSRFIFTQKRVEEWMI
jgi:glycosyltransferase involved in cell wall biosynthesis